MQFRSSAPRGRFHRARRAVLATVAMIGAVTALGASPASASTTYSQRQTLPVPPASSFTAEGAGDGWDISLSNDRVFNVFHHGFPMQVACHRQVDAGRCWPDTHAKEIRDSQGRSFSTSNQSGTHLDQRSGKLYTYGTRIDLTAGVVCIDTLAADDAPNPFCGFTPLTEVGAAGGDSYPEWNYLSPATLSNPVLVGARLYAGSYLGRGTTPNSLLCFDVTTATPCPGQPYQVTFGGASSGGWSWAAAAIGGRIVVGSPSQQGFGCFDTTTAADCGGSWPITTPAYNGSPFPLLTATGVVSGVCIPSNGLPCFSLTGAPVATPSGMAGVLAASPWGGAGNTNYNGEAVVIGPRVYLPQGNGDQVQCYDASTNAGCPNFPKQLPGSFMYTVNRDPQRPACLWTNADYGQRIQSFDAYTGGPCGQGAIRVLASQFIVPLEDCVPTAYDRLDVLAPARSTYTSGSVQFANGAGNSLGLADQVLDADGGIDLTGLELNTATGLPQFLISLEGATGTVGQVEVELTWTGSYDPACVAPTTAVTNEATTAVASITGGGLTGPTVTIDEGASATAAISLSGTNAAAAGGTVTYAWYADTACTSVAAGGTPQMITTPGQLPASAPVELARGTYNVVATYSGDAGNLASATACGAAVLKVKGGDSEAPVITAAATTAPVNGWYRGDVTVTFTCTDEEGGSGIAAGACPAPQVLTGEGASISSVARTVTDEAGNVSEPSNVVTVRIDRTKPVLAFTGGKASYSMLEQVTITCTATDALSGIATSTCPSVSGAAWTFGAGTESRTASAADKAGNTNSVTVSFEVVATAGGLNDLVAAFTTHGGTRTSLAAHLTNYERSKAGGKAPAAAAQLQAFRDGVNERIGKQFTASQAATLLSFTNNL